MTNRQSHLQYVCDELYSHWGVEVVAQWFWVKVSKKTLCPNHLPTDDTVGVKELPSPQVTTSGEYVFPLDSPHKKPYEVLVLGRCTEKSIRLGIKFKKN